MVSWVLEVLDMDAWDTGHLVHNLIACTWLRLSWRQLIIGALVMHAANELPNYTWHARMLSLQKHCLGLSKCNVKGSYWCVLPAEPLSDMEICTWTGG